MSDSQERADAKPSSEAKKPYSAPKLTEYGSVSKLTMSGGSTWTESGVPKKRKATCL